MVATTAASASPDPEPYPELRRFLAHSDVSYHALDDAETVAIRRALIDWYVRNRRRLPWRGDAPPYNGSTAGTNSGASKQQQLPQAAAASASVEDAAAAAAPPAVERVSAYGVWVSEIMCQQTRVEARR